jgi:glycosyltransferase involved in cell wall biosynthesis
MPKIDLLIPARNEEPALREVLPELRGRKELRRICVVDNGSQDGSGELAAEYGALVVREDRPGYGSACLAGIAALAGDPPDILVFMDADRSDHPEDLPLLLAPLLEAQADLVIGSRVIGQAERGSLTPQQRWGNWLACRLIRLFWGVHFTDLGPFRAISWPALQRLCMADPDFGWTVEMQIKAAQCRLTCCEVPVRYRRRIGVSKISGTLSGVFRAGWKILFTLFKARIQQRNEP